jgi:predicted DNA-binding transcriptional regulator AlpA
MTDCNGRRPARFVRKPEVARVLQKTVKTVDRMIRRGELPKPVKLTNGSVIFPLEELVAWWRVRSDKLAFEFENLAYTPAEKPEALPQQIAKQFQRETGERPEYIMYSSMRQATQQEVDAIHAAHYAQLDHCGRQAFGELDTIEGLMVMYGLIPSLRELVRTLFEQMSTRMGVPPPTLPQDEQAHEWAWALLATTKQQREEIKKLRKTG